MSIEQMEQNLTAQGKDPKKDPDLLAKKLELAQLETVDVTGIQSKLENIKKENSDENKTKIAAEEAANKTKIEMDTEIYLFGEKKYYKINGKDKTYTESSLAEERTNRMKNQNKNAAAMTGEIKPANITKTVYGKTCDLKVNDSDFTIPKDIKKKK